MYYVSHTPHIHWLCCSDKCQIVDGMEQWHLSSIHLLPAASKENCIWDYERCMHSSGTYYVMSWTLGLEASTDGCSHQIFIQHHIFIYFHTFPLALVQIGHVFINVVFFWNCKYVYHTISHFDNIKNFSNMKYLGSDPGKQWLEILQKAWICYHKNMQKPY